MSNTYWVQAPTGKNMPDAYSPGELAYEADWYSDSVNVTRNLTPMLAAAGMPWWDKLDGAPASEVAGVLAGVQERMLKDRVALEKEHTPPNGWGSWQWAYDFVKGLRILCEDNPTGILGSHR